MRKVILIPSAPSMRLLLKFAEMKFLVSGLLYLTSNEELAGSPFKPLSPEELLNDQISLAEEIKERMKVFFYSS